MRRVKITGDFGTRNLKVVDVESGEALPVTKLSIIAGPEELLKAEIEVLVSELDIEGDVEVVQSMTPQAPVVSEREAPEEQATG